MGFLRSQYCPWFVALVAIVYGSGIAFFQATTDLAALDLDGWAVKTQHYPHGEMPFSALVTEPSLWKGPIIPTLYHGAYYVWPSPYSVIGLNVLAFGIASGLLYQLFSTLGDQRAALVAVMAWIFMPQNRILFAYYFAEPLVGFLSVVAFWLIVRHSQRAFWIGIAMAVLLLARPPFLLIAVLVPLLVFGFQPGSRTQRLKWCGRYLFGFLIAYLPWVIRNALVLGAFVPFTVEGGQTLFHGTCLSCEEDRWQVLNQTPEVQRLLEAAPTDPVQRMHYFSGLAKKQFWDNPLGQLRFCSRKALKFWMYLPVGSWLPEWKTGTFAILALLMAGWTVYRDGRKPVVYWSTAWILGLWGIHTIVFSVLRYNFPVFPMLVFLAGSAVWRPKSKFD
jgi:hypothetical protein